MLDDTAAIREQREIDDYNRMIHEDAPMNPAGPWPYH